MIISPEECIEMKKYLTWARFTAIDLRNAHIKEATRCHMESYPDQETTNLEKAHLYWEHSERILQLIQKVEAL